MRPPRPSRPPRAELQRRAAIADQFGLLLNTYLEREVDKLNRRMERHGLRIAQAGLTLAFELCPVRQETDTTFLRACGIVPIRERTRRKP